MILSESAPSLQIILESLWHMNRLLDLMLLLIMLLVRLGMLLLLVLQLLMLQLLKLQLLRLLLFLLVGAMALVAAVSIAGIEAEANLGELERLLGGHLRLQAFLVLLVVDTLGMHPCSKLA